MKTVARKPNTHSLLEAHFAEDRICFARMDKRNDKTEQLLEQMGEHLSHLRKDMNIMVMTQDIHTEENKRFQEESNLFRASMSKTMEEIKLAVTPLISIHQKDEDFKEVLQSRGKWLLWFSGILIAFGVVVTYIKKALGI